jgi:hypothetical protein
MVQALGLFIPATTATCSSPLAGPADVFERRVTELIERVEATAR